MPKLEKHQSATLFEGGIHIKYLNEPIRGKYATEAHTDDYYQIVFVVEGTAAMEVDHVWHNIEAGEILMLIPGQVHRIVNTDNAAGYTIMIDAALVSPNYKSLLHAYSHATFAYKLEEDDFKQIETLLTYIQAKQEEIIIDVKRHFTLAILGIIVNTISLGSARQELSSRKFIIAHQFTEMVEACMLQEKSPSYYADRLNITTAYLNEAMQAYHNMSSSAFIGQMIMTEAKRLLIYTDMSIKEVARALGYDDYAYFSKLFQRTNGCSATQFRSKNKE